jgi:hypothetical protein
MTLARLRETLETMSFRGFQCWDQSAVAEVFDREAAAVTPEVLLATHVAPPIQRVSRIGGEFVAQGPTTEDQLLALLEKAEDPSLILPIIGASGSGKSHLVLWLRESLLDDPNRRVIYLPKSDTTLTGVIERLLEGHTGGRFDELLNAVRHASSSMTDRERALRLRADLAIRVEQTVTDDQVERYVAAHLPALLNDAGFEARLVDTGGAVHRIVTEATRGGLNERTDFRPEDLDLDLPITEVEAFGAKAKAFWGQLRRDRRILDAAIALLNRHRDRAVSRVFGVNPMELVAVMRDVRAALLAENPDLRLLLMIEDFTLLQGIQHDLLEAMIELPRREGQAVMAPMTTVMAVTDGFFASVLDTSDTLRSRIEAQGHMYSLDAAYEQDSAAAGQIEPRLVREFVGRYLNASRIGSAGLANAAPNVPNACESCALRGRCHEAFGTDDGERGLYPFNATAIDRMVRSRGTEFNPRDMLTVMSSTLVTHAPELAEGRFPSPSWARMFEIAEYRRRLPSLSLAVDRQARATQKGDQRAQLLTFWGGVPDDLVNLEPDIHEAFDIPQVEGRVVVTAIVRRDNGDDSSRRRPAVTDVDEVGERVRLWRDGDRLGESDAREVRRFVAEVMLAALNSEARMLSNQILGFKQETDVNVKNAEGGGGSRRQRERFAITIEPDEEGVFLVEGILRASDSRVAAGERVARSDWSFEGGLQHLAALLRFGHVQAEAYAKYLGTQAILERRNREARLQALYYSGLVLGIGDAQSTEGRLAATFATTAGAWQHAPDQWRMLATQLEKQRESLRATVTHFAQVRQGSSRSELALDTTEVVRLLSSASAAITLGDGPDEPAYTNTKSLLGERLGTALDGVRTALAEWSAVVTPLLGDGDDWAALEKELTGTSQTLQGRAFPLQVDAVNNAMPTAQHVASALRKVAEVLGAWDGMHDVERARVVRDIPWVRLAPIREYAERWQRELARVRDRARDVGPNTGAASPRADFERALGDVRTTMAGLLAEAQA